MPAFFALRSLLKHANAVFPLGAVVEIVLPLLPLFLLYFLQPDAPAAIDMSLHLRMANDYALVLFSTHGIPDWDPLVFNGFGAPTFRFVGHLPLMLASFFGLAGFAPGTALKLTVLLFALAGSWGMRDFLRSEGLAWPRRLVGCLGLFSGPGVAMHLFHNFFFQHVCAVLIFPCVLAGMKRNLRWFAAGIGLMCWTHLQMAFVCSCLIGIVTMIQGGLDGSPRCFARFTLAALIGGFLAAPFWLPAVLSMKFIHVEGKEKVRPGIESLFIDDVFRSEKELPAKAKEPGVSSAPGTQVQSGHAAQNAWTEVGRIRGLIPALEYIWKRGGPIHSEYGWVLFRFLRSWILLMTLIALGLALLGAVLVRRPGVAPVGLVGLLAGVAMFRVSTPFWQVFAPLAELLEFSWRLLIPMQILLTPLMIDGGFACARVAGRRLFRSAAPAVFVILFGAFPAIAGIFAALSIPFTPSAIEYYINEAQAVAPMFKPAQAPMNKLGKSDSASLFPVSIMRGSGRLVSEEPGLAGTKFRAEIASGGAKIRIGAHYDTDWRLTGNGMGVRLMPDPADGAIIADLPAGVQDLVLERSMPSGRGIGGILLLIGVAALVLL